MIGFNKPYITGKEFEYIQEAIKIEKLSGNGYFTKKCHEYFEKRYSFKKTLLTHSCTAALEMAALLIEIGPGDEVIIPAYTFVSTANAFLLRGATVVFADSKNTNPNIDSSLLRSLITKRTKAIVVVHYAGVACDMDAIMALAIEFNLIVIEDAAHAIDSRYKERILGSIGHLATFSFHETKNIISGEGGMLVINDSRFLDRSEIIWEKGTNRAAFSRRDVKKYTWVDIGSSFLPSEITAAFLFAQLEGLDGIQDRRVSHWQQYYHGLKDLDRLDLPFIDEFAVTNGHIFYLVAKDEEERNTLLSYLHGKGIQAIFHYLPLNESPYFVELGNPGPPLKNAARYGRCLFRLPLFVDLKSSQIEFVIRAIKLFYEK